MPLPSGAHLVPFQLAILSAFTPPADQKKPPVYRVIREKGPEHRKMFTIEVRAAGNRTARGRGSSKKTAEQEAAQALLKKIKSRGR